ncbi:hypothetical protein GGI07_000832 [Coemansia sp. Benny D115]|nr:hypothetical protein GGI07_000832 [Coemansia sp. Benny D115]
MERTEGGGSGDPQQQKQQASKSKSPTTDASTEKKDDKVAPVRKRLSLACTTCRQRKVKCDGGRPSCRTCAKFSWPCVYQPSNRKRGPRPRALALMDGSIPYTSRSHWSTPHGYYGYGFPGRSPPLPPPPPPMPFYAPHQDEVPMDGAPVRAEPGRARPGDYSYDSYSSYGDYMSNTGAIRIQPSMRSPGSHSTAAPPMPMRGHPYAYPPQPQPQLHARGPYGDAMPPSSFSPVSPPSAPWSSASSLMAPGGYPLVSPPNAQVSAGQRARGVSDLQRLDLGATASEKGPAVSAMAESEIVGGGIPTSASLGSAVAPQRMHQSARSYDSASPYAPGMQPQGTTAAMHSPAIYARKMADIGPASIMPSAKDAAARPLPFSDGGNSRPRLPPLSEVFGKDFRSMRSPDIVSAEQQHLQQQQQQQQLVQQPAPPMGRKDSFRD